MLRNPYRNPSERLSHPLPVGRKGSRSFGDLAAWIGLVVLGALCTASACNQVPVKPAAYGTELTVCLEQSSTWREYEPCCADVAHRYGRDPGFCVHGADGGL